MKALLLSAYGKLDVVEMDPPVAGRDEALVRVRACGICGSDVHGYTGVTGRRIPPLVMGHEAAGSIVAVGADVRGFAPGDRVTFDSTVWCGTCGFCRSGRVNLCDARTIFGVSCGDYRRHGAFAELVAVPERILYRLPDSLPFEHAAMAEPLAVAVHAVDRRRPAAAERVAVIGCGMIGLLTIQVLRARGCAGILAADPNGERRALAARLGASETAADAGGLAGFDHVFEAVGTAETVAAAVRAVRKGGAVTLIGNLAPEVPLPVQLVVTREITLYGSCSSSGEYAEALALLASGAVDMAPLISAVAPLDEGPAWFDRLRRSNQGVLKVVLAVQEES